MTPPATIAASSRAFITRSATFLDVTGATPRLERVVTTDAHEGPVYVAAEDALYVTGRPQPADPAVTTPGPPATAIRRIQLDGTRFPVARDAVTTLVERSNMANGMTLDRAGRLIVCEQGSLAEPAAIASIDPGTGIRRVLADAWGGLPLNSPNDVALAPDGALWFTDPSYGALQGFRPRPQVGDYVYRLDPVTGDLRVVADDFDKPNGIAFSPDGAVLYVTDSGANQTEGSYHVERPHHVVAYDVLGGRRLGNRRLLAVTTPGFPDGLKVDAAGRVYASASSGVQVFSPDGDPLGEIHLPGAVNFTFGGPDRNVLFITTDTAVWAAVLNAQGA